MPSPRPRKVIPTTVGPTSEEDEEEEVTSGKFDRKSNTTYGLYSIEIA